MMFKNSVKLMFSNFSNVWKILVYILIVTLLGAGLLAPVVSKILIAFEACDVGGLAGEFFTTFRIGANPSDTFICLNRLIEAIFAGVRFLFENHTFVAIYGVLASCFVIPFLFSFADIPTGECLFGFMSSQAKLRFAGTYVRNLKKSTKYALWKALIFLPINLLIGALFCGVLRLASFQGVIQYFVPFFAVIIMSAAASFKSTFFSCWMPALVVYDAKPIDALKLGFKAVFRRFWKTYSTAFIFIIIFLMLALLFGVFSLIAVVPVAYCVFRIFYMTVFFGSQGMRYYVDNDNIISPKKLEEVDSFRKMKDLI